MRSPARKRPVPRDRTPGSEFGLGAKVVSDVSGNLIPERLTIVDEWGRRVSARPGDDEIDKSDAY